MYAVVAEFEIAEGQMETFLPLMHINAKASFHEENGCQQFDVLCDPARPNSVLLYEIYTDAEAFQAHLATPHFKRFDAAVAALIVKKSVRTFSEVTQ